MDEMNDMRSFAVPEKAAQMQMPTISEIDTEEAQTNAVVMDKAVAPRVFCMTFRRDDKVVVINGDRYVVHIIRNMIVSFWPAGLKRDGQICEGVWQLQFYGTPFASTTSKIDATNIRRLCASWLSGLAKAGWMLVASSELAGNLELTSWFFCNYNENHDLSNVQLLECSKVETSVVCVSVSKKDKLQLLNADDYLADQLRDAVGNVWLQDAIYDHKDTFRFRSSFIVKIYGNPWQSDQIAEIIKGRRILLNMFRRFHMRRCYYYGCVNVKGTADCLFFRQSTTLDQQGNYAMMSLSGDDRLILIDLPSLVQTQIQETINANWTNGVKSVMPHEPQDFKLACQEFHLNDRPWNCEGGRQAQARLMLAKIFDVLVRNGWSVHCALDLSRRKDDTAALVLRSCQPNTTSQHICLAPAEPDVLWLLNCTDDVREMLLDCVLTNWTAGVSRAGEQGWGYECRLRGDPWQRRRGKPDGRQLMLALLQLLFTQGWRVVCSADVSSKYSGNSPRPPPHQSLGTTDQQPRRQNSTKRSAPMDVHALFFVKDDQGNRPKTSISRSVTPNNLGVVTNRVRASSPAAKDLIDLLVV